MKTRKKIKEEEILKRIEELKAIIEDIQNSEIFTKEKILTETNGTIDISIERNQYINEENDTNIIISNLVPENSIEENPSVYYIQMTKNEEKINFSFNEKEIYEPEKNSSLKFLKDINIILDKNIKQEQSLSF